MASAAAPAKLSGLPPVFCLCVVFFLVCSLLRQRLRDAAEFAREAVRGHTAFRLVKLPYACPVNPAPEARGARSRS